MVKISSVLQNSETTQRPKLQETESSSWYSSNAWNLLTGAVLSAGAGALGYAYTQTSQQEMPPLKTCLSNLTPTFIHPPPQPLVTCALTCVETAQNFFQSVNCSSVLDPSNIVFFEKACQIQSRELPRLDHRPTALEIVKDIIPITKMINTALSERLGDLFALVRGANANVKLRFINDCLGWNVDPVHKEFTRSLWYSEARYLAFLDGEKFNREMFERAIADKDIDAVQAFHAAGAIIDNSIIQAANSSPQSDELTQRLQTLGKIQGPQYTGIGRNWDNGEFKLSVAMASDFSDDSILSLIRRGSRVDGFWKTSASFGNSKKGIPPSSSKDLTQLYVAVSHGYSNEVIEEHLKRGANIHIHTQLKSDSIGWHKSKPSSPLQVTMMGNLRDQFDSMLKYAPEGSKDPQVEAATGYQNPYRKDLARNAINSDFPLYFLKKLHASGQVNFKNLNSVHKRFLIEEAIIKGGDNAYKILEFFKELDFSFETTRVTPVSYMAKAAKEGSRQAIKFLLDIGHDINDKDLDFNINSPLAYAIEYYRSNDFLQFLLDNGAKVDTEVDIFGEKRPCILEYAEIMGASENRLKLLNNSNIKI